MKKVPLSKIKKNKLYRNSVDDVLYVRDDSGSLTVYKANFDFQMPKSVYHLEEDIFYSTSTMVDISSAAEEI